MVTAANALYPQAGLSQSFPLNAKGEIGVTIPVAKLISAASASMLALCLFGCSSGGVAETSYDGDDAYSSSSSDSSYGSSSSSSTTPPNYGSREDGMTSSRTDEDGYSYYEYDDGSAEVTDGYGNVGRDSDGDGSLDSFSFDGGETWEEF